MVPEEDNKPGSTSESEDSKVKIDDQEVSDSSVKSNQKVELDLDDAPFLDWEEDSEEEEAGEEEKEVAKGEEEQEEGEKERKDPVLVRIKRWWWVWAAATLLLLVSVSVVIWFVSAQDTTSRKKLPQVVEEKKPNASGKNKTKQMKQVSLEPFWVEYNTNNTYTHLHLGIDLGVQGKKPAWELEKKIPVIRDSLYYFLKNKQIDELSDKNNIEDLKKEIQGIVNNNLSKGKVDQVLVQKYLVE